MSQRSSNSASMWDYGPGRAQGMRPGSGSSASGGSNTGLQTMYYLGEPARQSSLPTATSYNVHMTSNVSKDTSLSSVHTLPQQHQAQTDYYIPSASKSSSIWSTESVFTTPPASYQHDQDYSNGTERSRPKSYSQSWGDMSASTWPPSDFSYDTSENSVKGKGKSYNQRKPSNRDEFDGPHQLLETPSPGILIAVERELPHLATNLFVDEQDQILSQVNDRLSQCAFDFVAKYQFPIPLESDKRPVRVPADREWTEWVYLLKRLATKRRIPARVLYNGQIKQLITILENSLEMRHAAKHQSRPLKDDRNVLQLISAGLQVAKILKDAEAMEYLDQLYVKTERMIQMRKNSPGYMG